MRPSSLIASLTVLAAVLFLANCATAIPVELTRPAELDLAGSATITVLPFGFPSQMDPGDQDRYALALARLWFTGQDENPREKLFASRTEGALVDALLATGFFQVLKPGQLRDSLASGDTGGARQKLAADAVITGKLSRLEQVDADESFTDKKTGRLIEQYRTTLRVRIDYEVLLGSSGTLVASRNYTSERSGSYYRWSDKERTVRNLEDEALREFAGQVRKEVAPYKVVEYRYLESDSTKDPAMDQALKLVEQKDYRQALELYAGIYGKSGNPAAGFNAAIMKEVLGDSAGALADMETLARVQAWKKAADEALRMKQTMAATAAARAQKDAQKKNAAD